MGRVYKREHFFVDTYHICENRKQVVEIAKNHSNNLISIVNIRMDKTEYFKKVLDYACNHAHCNYFTLIENRPEIKKLALECGFIQIDPVRFDLPINRCYCKPRLEEIKSKDCYEVKYNDMENPIIKVKRWGDNKELGCYTSFFYRNKGFMSKYFPAAIRYLKECYGSLYLRVTNNEEYHDMAMHIYLKNGFKVCGNIEGIIQMRLE